MGSDRIRRDRQPLTGVAISTLGVAKKSFEIGAFSDPRGYAALARPCSASRSNLRRTTPDEMRTARFRCVLALARDGRTLSTYEGVVEGALLRAPRGAGGFGYDPIFFHPPSQRSFAELTLAEKERVSHRGLALRRLRDDIRRP